MILSREDVINSGLFHRVPTDPPLVISHAQGSYIYLQDGKKLLDASGGAAVVSVGHGNPEVIAAVNDQLSKVSYISSASYTTSAAEELSNALLEGYEDRLSKVWFANSGSEANESAIKLVTQFFYLQGKTSKTQFISRDMSYHGNCLGGISLSGHKVRRAPYEKIIPGNFHKVSPLYEYRYKNDSETSEQYVDRLTDELELKILSLGPENVAAFVLEPVVGACTGCVTAPKGYFAKVRAICDKYDVLLVLDEIMCGSGRTGTFFAWEQEGIVPDITTSGKAVSSGYGPLSCIFFSHKLTSVLGKDAKSAFVTGHTYQAYPLSCAAALSVQKIIKRDQLLQNVIAMGDRLSSGLKANLTDCAIVGDIRGRGLFWGIEFVKDKDTKLTMDGNFGLKIQQQLVSKGVSVYPGHGTYDGTVGDHIIIAPSFDVDEEIIDHIIEVVTDVIQEESKNFI